MRRPQTGAADCDLPSTGGWPSLSSDDLTHEGALPLRFRSGQARTDPAFARGANDRATRRSFARRDSPFDMAQGKLRAAVPTPARGRPSPRHIKTARTGVSAPHKLKRRERGEIAAENTERRPSYSPVGRPEVLAIFTRWELAA